MNSSTKPSPTETVLGRRITITKESGATVDLTLRAFRVREFNELMPLLGNEPALIEKALDVSRGALVDGADPILPESYEALAECFHQLNQPFFAYCTRQSRLMSQVQGKTLERALTTALERTLSSSGAGSSGLPSPAV